MENYKNIQKQKYLIFKLNKKKEKYKSILQTYSDDEVIELRLKMCELRLQLIKKNLTT